MGNLKGHGSSGLQVFATQGVTSKNSALSVNGSEEQGEDDCLPEAPSPLLEPDEDKNQRNSVDFVCKVSSDILEAVCLQESEHMSVTPGEEHFKSRPLASQQPCEIDVVPPPPGSNGNCCGDVLPSDPVVPHVALDCAEPADERTEPVSHGQRVLRETPGNPAPRSVTITAPTSGQDFPHLPRIVKHKPSSITFSHYNFTSAAGGVAFVNNESSDDDSAGEEKEDDDPDCGDNGSGDVFEELPQCRELPVNHRQRSRDRQRRRGAVSARTDIDNTTRNCGYEAEGESSSKEVMLTFKVIHHTAIRGTGNIHQLILWKRMKLVVFVARKVLKQQTQFSKCKIKHSHFCSIKYVHFCSHFKCGKCH